MKKYKFLEHTADIKFLVNGKSINEIFENSVRAISGFISRETKIKENVIKKFILKGKDYEELFYNFIDELIYLLDAKNFICSKGKVKIKEKEGSIMLDAKIYGDKTKNYKNLEHIKAATYSEMYVKKKGNKWEARAVIDV